MRRRHRPGDVVAGATGAAHVDDHLRRVERPHSTAADELVAEHRDPAERREARPRLVGRGDGALPRRRAADLEGVDRQVERGEQQRRRRGRLQDAQPPVDHIVLDEIAAHVQQRRLGQRGQRLVRALHDEVGPEGQRRRRQAPCTAGEVRAVGLVHDERYAMPVSQLGEGGDVGTHPVVARAGDVDRSRRRVCREQRARLVHRGGERHGEVVVVPAHEIPRARSRKRDPPVRRSVRCPHHDQVLAGAGDRKHGGEVPDRGPVHQEPGAVGAEHTSGAGLGGGQLVPGVVQVVETLQLGDVGGERHRAEQRPRRRRRASAPTVAGHVERPRLGRCPPPQHRVAEVRRHRLIALSPCRPLARNRGRFSPWPPPRCRRR